MHASAWTEAVFHVLAHVDVGRVAASCHDARWIRHAEQHLGPARERKLAEDATVLANALATHELLARAQALAWVFPSADAARAAAAQDLADLERSVALHVALAAGASAEVLRAAAELELAAIESLPARPEASDEILRDVVRAAPNLSRCEVSFARPLPSRGRAFGTSIVVGFPGVAGAESDFVAWQAAHEATVLEIGRGEFADVERRALGLLRARARRTGLAHAHARWLSGVDLSALGPIPDVDDVGDGAP